MLHFVWNSLSLSVQTCLNLLQDLNKEINYPTFIYVSSLLGIVDNKIDCFYENWHSFIINFNDFVHSSKATEQIKVSSQVLLLLYFLVESDLSNIIKHFELESFKGKRLSLLCGIYIRASSFFDKETRERGS